MTTIEIICIVIGVLMLPLLIGGLILGVTALVCTFHSIDFVDEDGNLTVDDDDEY